MQETQEVHGNPLQYSCLENLIDRGAWWAAVYGVAQSRTRLKRLSSSSSNTHSASQAALQERIRLPVQEMQESRIRSLGWEDPLEEGMATHCSILAWKIPWTEEPDGLQSIGLQRVGHE